jgi:hypothetical protein
MTCAGAADANQQRMPNVRSDEHASSSTRLWAAVCTRGACQHHLHAHFGRPSVPCLCCAPRHFIKRQEVGRPPKIFMGLVQLRRQRHVRARAPS